jgi:two-component system CheB/CheR fusion protein
MVYVLTENTYVVSDEGWLKVSQRPADIVNEAVDVFFSSAAADFGQKTIGVVLSGGGKDGAMGCERIEAAGGTVLVQEPESAQFSSMPATAIALDHPTAIMAPAELAASCIKIINGGI